MSCHPTGGHGRHRIHPRVHPGLAPQAPWGEGPRGLYLEGEEGVKSHRFSLKDGKKSGGVNLDPHKKRGQLGVSEAAVLVLALPQGVQTVQPVLRASQGVPGGAALEEADDFVNRRLLVLVGPPVFEGKT